jgi:hypothetical protein
LKPMGQVTRSDTATLIDQVKTPALLHCSLQKTIDIM